MENQWYWKDEQDLLGPLSTEELERLIQQGRIADHDEIRPEGSEEWLSGEAIKAMFVSARAESDSTTDDSTTAGAASKLLSQTRLQPWNAGQSTNTGRSHLARGLANTGGVVSSLLEWVAMGIVAVAQRLPGLRKRWITVFVAVAILGSLLLQGIDLNGGENRRIYQQFSEMIQLLQHKRDLGADPSEWQQLQQTLLPQIEEAKAKLLRLEERYPRTLVRTRKWRFDFEVGNSWTRRNLIQVTYPLSEIIRQGASATPAAFERLEHEMGTVQRHLSGKFMEEYRARKAKLRKGKPEGTGGVDLMTAGIVGVDLLLVLGAAVFFLRRK